MVRAYSLALGLILAAINVAGCDDKKPAAPAAADKGTGTGTGTGFQDQSSFSPSPLPSDSSSPSPSDSPSPSANGETDSGDNANAVRIKGGNDSFTATVNQAIDWAFEIDSSNSNANHLQVFKIEFDSTPTGVSVVHNLSDNVGMSGTPTSTSPSSGTVTAWVRDTSACSGKTLDDSCDSDSHRQFNWSFDGSSPGTAGIGTGLGTGNTKDILKAAVTATAIDSALGMLKCLIPGMCANQQYQQQYANGFPPGGGTSLYNGYQQQTQQYPGGGFQGNFGGMTPWGTNNTSFGGNGLTSFAQCQQYYSQYSCQSASQFGCQWNQQMNTCGIQCNQLSSQQCQMASSYGCSWNGSQCGNNGNLNYNNQNLNNQNINGQNGNGAMCTQYMYQQSSCQNATQYGCYWNGSTCTYNPTGNNNINFNNNGANGGSGSCTQYSTAVPCNAQPNCQWSNNMCVIYPSTGSTNNGGFGGTTNCTQYSSLNTCNTQPSCQWNSSYSSCQAMTANGRQCAQLFNQTSCSNATTYYCQWTNNVCRSTN